MLVDPFSGLPVAFQALFWFVFAIALSALISTVTLAIAAVRFDRRRRQARGRGVLSEPDYLWVFLVPALDEELTIADSVSRLRATTASDALIVVINDGSTDGTAAVLDSIAGPDLRVITRTPPDAQRGKAAALNHAFDALRNEILREPRFAARDDDHVIVAVVDADGRVDPTAPRHIADQFDDPRLAGVQLRVRIYNRNNPLTWAQDLEFSTFALVFQAGRSLWGTANMGGNGQFNRLSALSSIADEAGPWRDRLTEDQDLGVRLLQAGWRGSHDNGTEVHQQGVPTLRRLFRQRTRWAQGTWQALSLIGGARKMKASPIARIDAVYYLLNPILQSLSGLALLLSIIFWLFFDIPYVPASITLILAFVAIGFGPGFVALLRLRRGIFGLLWAILLVVPYALYAWVIYPAVLMSLARQLTGRRGWAKTARVAVVDSATAA